MAVTLNYNDIKGWLEENIVNHPIQIGAQVALELFRNANRSVMICVNRVENGGYNMSYSVDDNKMNYHYRGEIRYGIRYSPKGNIEEVTYGSVYFKWRDVDAVLTDACRAYASCFGLTRCRYFGRDRI